MRNNTSKNRALKHVILFLAIMAGIADLYITVILGGSTLIATKWLFIIGGCSWLAGFMWLQRFDVLAFLDGYTKKRIATNAIVAYMFFPTLLPLLFLLAARLFTGPDEVFTAQVTGRSVQYTRNREPLYHVSYLLHGIDADAGFGSYKDALFDTATHIRVTCHKGLIGVYIITNEQLMP